MRQRFASNLALALTAPMLQWRYSPSVDADAHTVLMEYLREYEKIESIYPGNLGPYLQHCSTLKSSNVIFFKLVHFFSALIL
jgi:hypothetical protein